MLLGEHAGAHRAGTGATRSLCTACMICAEKSVLCGEMSPLPERKILATPVTAAMFEVQSAAWVLAACCFILPENWTHRKPYSLVEHGTALRPRHCWARSPCASRVIRTVQAQVAENEA